MSYGIKDASDIFLKRRDTGEIVFIPYLNTFKLDLKDGGAIYAKKKGANAIKWSKAMEGCTFEGTLEILNDEILSAMLGASLLTSSTDIFGKEKLTVTSAKVALTTTTAVKTGSLYVYKTTTDEVSKMKVFTETASATPAVGEFKYNSTNKEISFNVADVSDGTKIIVTYLLNVPNLKKAVVKSNASMPSYHLYANVATTDEATGGIDMKQLHLPNVSLTRNFSMELSTDNASSFSMSGDILADTDDTMLEFIDLLD